MMNFVTKLNGHWGYDYQSHLKICGGRIQMAKSQDQAMWLHSHGQVCEDVLTAAVVQTMYIYILYNMYYVLYIIYDIWYIIYYIPVVPHKAVAEVSKIGNL